VQLHRQPETMRRPASSNPMPDRHGSSFRNLPPATPPISGMELDASLLRDLSNRHGLCCRDRRLTVGRLRRFTMAVVRNGDRTAVSQRLSPIWARTSRAWRPVSMSVRRFGIGVALHADLGVPGAREPIGDLASNQGAGEKDPDAATSPTINPTEAGDAKAGLA
jgi:hypothetical protein